MSEKITKNLKRLDVDMYWDNLEHFKKEQQKNEETKGILQKLADRIKEERKEKR